jgi:hypothetical protein
MPEMKLAHESDDDTTPLHCSFCGSGQIVGNSDGSIACQYCDRSFTIRLQPSFSGMPQQMDQMNAGQPDFGPGGQGDPSTDDQQGGTGPIGADLDSSPDPGAAGGDGTGAMQQQPDDDEEDEQQPPLLNTSTGALLPYSDYLDHLAVAFAPDRQAVISRIRLQRKGNVRG